METSLRVLYVGPSDAGARPLVDEFERKGYNVHYGRVETPETLNAVLADHGWDVVLIEYGARYFIGFEALKLVKQHDWNLPVIIVSEPDLEEQAVAALHVGANDYVLRGSLARLVPAVQRAAREGEASLLSRRAEDALRQSEERYRELVENANDVVLSTDLSGNFTALNKAGEQISGYSRQELTAMNMAQVLTPESLRLAQQMIQLKLQDNRPTTYEVTMIARGGKRVPLELSTRLIYHDGRPVAVQGIARDITERKQAAEALRESEERYRSLFENASDIVYTHDLGGTFTSVNAASTRVTGYTPEEIIGRNISRLLAPDHLERAREMIRWKLAAGNPTTYEVDIITKDGRRLTLDINSRLMYRGGEAAGVQGIARDVTERRRAEEELRAREQKQRIVAEIGQHALASTDLEALFDDSVSAAAETLGAEYCSLLELSSDGSQLASRAGVGWHSGVVGAASVGSGPESQAGYALATQEPVIVDDIELETRFTVPAILHEHKVRSGMSVIVHGRDRPFGVLSVFSGRQRSFSPDDVHFLQSVANIMATAIERKRLEEERARHSKELATRVLQAQEAERKRISRELHDETAQTLSILLTNLDLVGRHLPAGNAMLKSSFERAGSLARRALDETRALSHDLRPTILDDAGLVAALEWLAQAHESFFAGHVSVDAEAPSPGALTPEIEVALFRIAQEALTNAGKHAHATHVRLSLFFTARAVHLSLEDNGRGFDRRHVPNPTREGRLGLYGMQERAALLGGTLAIHTSPGRGTTVEVELPLAEAPATPLEAFSSSTSRVVS
ncbi:MAG TPA: PAS domain S-box protein [Chloroflexota bacterium]